jgi:hypothetical protein
MTDSTDTTRYYTNTMDDDLKGLLAGLFKAGSGPVTVEPRGTNPEDLLVTLTSEQLARVASSGYPCKYFRDTRDLDS